MSNWKVEFYSKYYSFFGRNLSSEDYRAFKPYGRYIVQRCFPKNTSIRILDMGCGIGGFLKVFQECGYKNSEGIDASEESVAFARSCGLHQVRHGEIVHSFKEIRDEEVDIVLFLDVLEHFSIEENIHLLREAYRVLKPSGSVIIHVPNAAAIFGAKIRYADITHEISFTASSMTQLTRYTGFSHTVCHEDKPIVHGASSFLRRLYWEVASLGFRLLHLAETGSYNVKLSQNILFLATKG